MMLPRLSLVTVLETARLLALDEVAEGDKRLAHLDEPLCRYATSISPGATFLAWPDMSLGFAFLWPDEDFAQRAGRLIAAYCAGRETLELLALDQVHLFDPSLIN